MREGRPISPISTNQEAAEMENLTEQDSALRTNFKAALMRLLTNKLYMWNFFSSIFIVFAFMGFGTFMPKYVEYQFRSDVGDGWLNRKMGRLVERWVAK
jgi:hypothetical protein